MKHKPRVISLHATPNKPVTPEQMDDTRLIEHEQTVRFDGTEQIRLEDISRVAFWLKAHVDGWPERYAQKGTAGNAIDHISYFDRTGVD